jgi:predicted metal-dependent phosphoesterase TrpH
VTALGQSATGVTPATAGRTFVDLHVHTNASFDCLSDPGAVVRAAAKRGLTHIAITDHDRIDGALAARAAAPAGLTVIVGEEVKTSNGDLICLFLERAVPPGRSPAETIAAVRAQGGLVGIPHPFDRFRNSLLRPPASRAGRSHAGSLAARPLPLRDESLASLAGLVDWVEAYNARLVGGGNDKAADFAREHGLPGIAVSDAHSVIEVAVAYTVLTGNPATADGLRAALPSAQIVPGRASYVMRVLTPVAKVVQRARGNGRIQPQPHDSQPHDEAGGGRS